MEKFQECFGEYRENFDKSWIALNDKNNDENMASLEESYEGMKSHYWRTIEAGECITRHVGEFLTKSENEVWEKWCKKEIEKVEDKFFMFQDRIHKMR